MTFYERIFHSILFEMGAMTIGVVAVLLAGDFSLEAAAGTGVATSVMAMVLNFFFNYVFDKIFTGKREERGLKLRILHTVCFEGTLLLLTIPVVAYLLALSLWHAFLADIGLSLLIMLYALVFNWLYDVTRVKFLERKNEPL